MNEGGQPHLSDDERAVLALVCDGLTNREIAAQVGSRESLVAGIIARMLKESGLRNRIQLAVWAVSRGLA